MTCSLSKLPSFIPTEDSIGFRDWAISLMVVPSMRLHQIANESYGNPLPGGCDESNFHPKARSAIPVVSPDREASI